MAGEIALPQAIYRISTPRFVCRLAEQAAIWLLGFVLVLHDTPVTLVIGVVLLGVVYARNLEFVHECLHATALPNAAANRLVGQALALPMLVSFERWRYEHAQHHRDVRIEGFRYDYHRLTTLTEMVVHVLMLRHFTDAIGHVVGSVRRASPAFPMRLARRVRRDYLAIAAFIVAATAMSVICKTWMPLWLWIAPLPVAAIVHTHIELPEHLGLAHDLVHPQRNTRIIRTNAFWQWFVNANNFHAVHHWNARIPMANVSGVHRVIDLAAPSERYPEFFARFYRGLLRSP